MSYKKRLISLLGVITILLSLPGCKKNEETNNTSVSYDTVNEEINAMPKYHFYYENDTYNLEESIDGLGIVNDGFYPYDTYKVLRYIDYNNEEKFAIARCYVDYVKDGNKGVADEIYYYYDVFNGNYLLGTYERRDIKTINSDVVYYLIEQVDLLDLKEIVIRKGLNADYVNSVMSDDIKNKSLSVSEVARMFVLLVNSNNRENYNNADIVLELEG